MEEVDTAAMLRDTRRRTAVGSAVSAGGGGRRPAVPGPPCSAGRGLRWPAVRVAMLSWEYPPLVVGGISAHVDGLARALARAGHEVVVLTLHHPDAPDDSVVDGVRVLRARADLPWLPDDHFVAHMAVGQPPPRRSSPPASTAGGPTSCTPTTGSWPGRATRCT